MLQKFGEKIVKSNMMNFSNRAWVFDWSIDVLGVPIIFID
jgi:hypothetical protein